LEGTTETIPVQDGFLLLDAEMSLKEVESSVSGGGGGGFSIFGFGASGSASYKVAPSVNTPKRGFHLSSTLS
jgi:hypothetical protein